MSVTEREAGSRADFLATVRRAVATPHAHATRPVAPIPDSVPDVAYVLSTDDRVEAFRAALTALGGTVRVVDGEATWTALVEEALAIAKPTQDRPTRVMFSAEPEWEAVAAALAERDDVELLDYTDAAAVATADLGITGARGGVALTGSIVVDAERAGGRTVSLLPPVHLALVDASTIVASPGEMWRSLSAPMPSNVVQITGPSRSADIELVITLGVHGPRSLLVGVLTEVAEAGEGAD